MNRYLPFYSKFMGGYNNKQLLTTIKYTKFPPIIDYAKEGVQNKKDIILYKKTLFDTIQYLNKSRISNLTYALKLSSFMYKNEIDIKSINETINMMKEHNVSKILLDAENIKYSEYENKIYKNVIEEHKDQLIYRTYQMYKINNFDNIVNDINHFTKLNIPFGIKLVRGAYYHTDKNSNLLYFNIEDTHYQYNKAILYILNQMKTNKLLHIFIATHNNNSINIATNYIKTHNLNNNNIAFAQLLGFNDSISSELLTQKYNVFKYIPYGSLIHSLPYLLRRLYENPGILKYFIR